MKKIILVCLLAMLVSVAGFAQSGQSPAAQKTAKLKTSLSLTDDQVVKITAIYTAHDNSIDSLKKQDNGDVGADMKKMFSIITTANNKIMAILTKDQAATFKLQVDAQNAYMKKMIDGQ
jgi:periplasmic protein CpxP/Spy